MSTSKIGSLALIGAITMLAACQQQPSGFTSSPAMGSGKALAPMESPAMQEAQRKDSTLAYEHTVMIEQSKELLPTRIRDVQSACQAAEQFGCTLLDVSISSNQELPSGNIRMRLAPAGVDSIIDIASKDGKVVSRSTHAEDLAEPVADTERQLSLLSTHRDRLSEFMKSKDLKVDQLITVSKELAEVQTRIDQLNSTRANLRRRIDTELLTISLSLPAQEFSAAHSPIRDSLRSFGYTFRQAVAQVISFIAIIVPWLVIIVPGIIALRLFWRRISRWLNRREQASAG